MFKLAIFTATRWECNAIRRSFLVDRVSTVSNLKCIIGRNGQTHIFLFRTGVGSNKAAQVCHAALEGRKWDLVISTGYAAALTPSRIGSILVATQVLEEPKDPLSHHSGNPLLCHPEFVQKAFKVGLSLDEHTQSGSIVTVQRIINRAVEKKELANRTGGIGLDMESATVGQIAHEQKIPFVVVRAISDLMDEDLPEEFNLFLGPSGWVQGLPSVILSPKSWAQMFRLRTQMLQTSRQITKFFQMFFRLGNLRDSQQGQTSSIG